MGGFGYPLCMMKVSNCTETAFGNFTCQPLHLGMPGCLGTPVLGSPECLCIGVVQKPGFLLLDELEDAGGNLHMAILLNAQNSKVHEGKLC